MRAIAALPLCLILVLGASACQTPPHAGPVPEARARPVDVPVPDTAPAGNHYVVDSARSELRMVIWPEGALGHAHVIGGQALSGAFVLPSDHQQVWLDLTIRVEALQVDAPDWRVDERLDPGMSERAIAGTRDNMLSTQVLNATEHPEIRIRAHGGTGPLWQTDIPAQITLAGTSRVILVPVSVHQAADEELEVIGRLWIRQTDFGIEPFSALGGVLRVADEMLIRFRIRAAPRDGGAAAVPEAIPP